MCSLLTSRKTTPSRLAAGLLLLALSACATHAQQQARFAFATQAQARAVLGAQDDYVSATSALERPMVLAAAGPMDAERFAAAMQATALDWSATERSAFDPVFARLERFLSAMKWQAPATILLVKTSDRLMEGFPHTRGNAIVIQEGMLREMRARPAMLEFLVVHEAFHVLTRADRALREGLYSAIGFRRCASIELPEALVRLRLTNPDAPENRHAIRVQWRGRPVEALPFVHFTSENIDPKAGFVSQMKTSWLLVERQQEHCVARDEGATLQELEGLREQVGNNTGYLIHPEEILADNFALLYRETVTPGVTRIRSPEILERIRSVVH